MLKTNGHTAPKIKKGIFGIKLPEGFRYKVSSPAELKEVKWLIKEGAFKTIKEYEDHTTKALLGELK